MKESHSLSYQTLNIDKEYVKDVFNDSESNNRIQSRHTIYQI